MRLAWYLGQEEIDSDAHPAVCYLILHEIRYVCVPGLSRHHPDLHLDAEEGADHGGSYWLRRLDDVRERHGAGAHGQHGR